MTVLGLVALMGLLMWLVLYLTGGSGIMLDLDVFMALSHLGKLALIIELVAVRLLMTIVFVVALSELYVVISNRNFASLKTTRQSNVELRFRSKRIVVELA
jgi:hypothetical protein